MEPKRSLSESDKKTIACSQRWMCNICNDILPSTYEVDHIVPFSISHNDNYENLQAICNTCHSLKTQKECNRIYKFKKLCSLKGEKLCWFCTNKLEENHVCSKVLVPIKFNKVIENKNVEKFESSINKFINVNDKTLYIKFKRDSIWVNNYYTDVGDYTIKSIHRAIYIGTKYHKKKYNKLEITIDFDEEVSDEVIDFLSDGIEDRILNMRIFEKNTDYEFICLE